MANALEKALTLALAGSSEPVLTAEEEELLSAKEAVSVAKKREEKAIKAFEKRFPRPVAAGQPPPPYHPWYRIDPVRVWNVLAVLQKFRESILERILSVGSEKIDAFVKTGDIRPEDLRGLVETKGQAKLIPDMEALEEARREKRWP